MSYTALVHDKNKALRQRIKFNSLSQIPDNCIVKCRGKNLRNLENFSELYVSDKLPLLIYYLEEPLLIFVKTLTGRTYELSINSSYTTWEIKREIWFLEGCTPDQQRIIFDRKILEDIAPVSESRIENESTIYLVQRLRGGGRNKVIRRPIFGRDSTYDWQLYEAGFNILGSCSNKGCISFLRGGNVVKSYNFGKINFVKGEKLLTCPACETASFRINAGQSFLLSCCRTLIRFKQKPDDVETSVIYETTNNIDLYKRVGLKNGWAEFCMVEIVTVSLSSSPYFCTICELGIGEIENEVIFSCGHAYHNICLSELNIADKCHVCQFEIEENPDNFFDFCIQDITALPQGTRNDVEKFLAEDNNETDPGSFQSWGHEFISYEEAIINEAEPSGDDAPQSNVVTKRKTRLKKMCILS